MPPKRNPRPVVEVAPEALFNHNRSVYGGNHAVAETALLAGHAQHLRNIGAIDEYMVAELTKPYSKPDIRSVRYTTEYLAAHSDYTGEDVDAMPTLQSAMKHQRYRDEAQTKMLEDYQAGRIDIWGNPTAYREVAEDGALLSRAQGTYRKSGMLRAYKSHDLPMLEGELVGDTTEVDDSSSDHSAYPTISRQRHRIDRVQKGNTKMSQSNAPKHFTNLPAKGAFSAATPPSFKKRVAQFRHNPDVLPPSITSTGTHYLSSSIRDNSSRTPSNAASGTTPSEAIFISASPQPPSPHHSRQARAVVPLQPQHGSPDYTELDYYKATALCRKLGIPSGGNLHEVRNHLIWDDTAVREGSPRVMALTSYRKVYRTAAPGLEGTGC